jgi:ATP-dependent helicase/nuclease subunit B
MNNIYRASSKENFLQEIVDFAKENYAGKFADLKIILPSGLLCSELQKTFIKNFQTSILPTIIPFSDLVAESEEVFKIPSEQIGSLSKLEERITLASVIHSYDKLGYNLSQSLRLAPSLSNLFFEFEANEIKLEDLKNLPTLAQAEHWHNIYNFLCYALANWHDKIRALHKISKASYQKLIFDSELKRLKNAPGKFLLLAGITGDNLMSNNFIKNATALENVKLILPPYIDLEQKKELSPEHGLYKIYQLLDLLKPNNKPELLTKSKNTILDKLLDQNALGQKLPNIDYIEFENIFHEAEYIASVCAKMQEAKIAIIVHDKDSKEQYCTALKKYDLNYRDIWGEDILKQPVISLLLLIAEYFCAEFNAKNLFSLISHPLLHSSEAQKIKNLIRKKHRLAQNLEEITKIINEHADEDLKEFYEQLTYVLEQKISSKNFASIFKKILQLSEKLLPNIWDITPSISWTLAEINQMNWQLDLVDIEEFPEILKQLLEGGRISGTTPNANITICRANEAAFIYYDLAIITNLNDSTYPVSGINNAWLNPKMQKELGLDKNASYLGKSLYDFYLNLQNQKIILTRAKKQSSNKQSLPSPFLLHLMHILGDNLQHSIMKPALEKQELAQVELHAKAHLFPKKISATDIETLIRAPYNFYAKKILNLKKIEEIDERPNLADFGNFFHEAVEQYTKNYSKTDHNKELALKEIAKSILENAPLPNHSKKSWLIKFNAIAPEFIEFDEERRQTTTKTYSEIKGELKLDILDQEVTILAIADRIDLHADGSATILDYKTGAVPSQKDVLSGLSPQLLIEAIILFENGFKITAAKVSSMIYVKINSASPYITTTEIKLSPEDFAHHKQGLINLLEHYVRTMEFATQPNLMKYDNYSHLARRL